MPPILKKEATRLLSNGGVLVYYYKTGTAKIQHGDVEYVLDRRTYHGLTKTGHQPKIIGGIS